jgi:hypothetical protein
MRIHGSLVDERNGEKTASIGILKMKWKELKNLVTSQVDLIAGRGIRPWKIRMWGEHSAVYDLTLE